MEQTIRPFGPQNTNRPTTVRALGLLYMLNVKYWRIFLCDVISLLAQVFIVSFDRTFKEVSSNKICKFSMAQILWYDCTYKKQCTVPVTLTFALSCYGGLMVNPDLDRYLISWKGLGIILNTLYGNVNRAMIIVLLIVWPLRANFTSGFKPGFSVDQVQTRV